MNQKPKVVWLQRLLPPDASWEEVKIECENRGLFVRRIYIVGTLVGCEIGGFEYRGDFERRECIYKLNCNRASAIPV
ncbi:hypothetical protein A3A70_02155 [candidate division WWE3 bacterium RIFCSPLOWO2_01_FULL_42_11]|uniref:Uncharacterized protein n=1 Tax=candidate division WWE3 bacterium RIFCSPLOWO2_01_FULL_42_11 TaxID=1802627 RepID=A0A1F4VRF3_UNCKA|nr:MAG: hypothetical protein A3A70_02155 [candidate division WWE3 bacterium RIFCSPLOWO2_01_FULL_42_11]